jgi:hypothetical protein
MGLDPALAISLQVGEKAAAKLAAIPDSEGLRKADEAITRGDVREGTRAQSIIEAKIERMAARLREGSLPDLAKASLIDLLALCVATDGIPQCREPTS